MNIPVPPRGYWAKKQAGQAVEITPLPESNGKSAILGSKSVSSSDTQKLLPNEELSFLDEIERSNVVAVSWNLHVNNDGHKLHPVLLKHIRTVTAVIFSRNHTASTRNTRSDDYNISLMQD